MDEIKDILKSYNLTEIQIDKFLNYFEYAKKNEINHPYYYAVIKTLIWH